MCTSSSKQQQLRLEEKIKSYIYDCLFPNVLAGGVGAFFSFSFPSIPLLLLLLFLTLAFCLRGQTNVRIESLVGRPAFNQHLSCFSTPKIITLFSNHLNFFNKNVSLVLALIRLVFDCDSTGQRCCYSHLGTFNSRRKGNHKNI